ncbi:hypothetical protein KHC33_11010 [Methanospirillum sp. J.3.6.1-F.2.7.3]|uniref:Uncharacterized protein n=1 Tax=Methanospirillum purgamenti TaxID=2834276 RepID=A0A8E7EG32_9EURY|nr:MULTISPECIES: hypothetical protein [Methanospirillum]MDX8551367.1 hypothetical protein [Methanospirillum hungatei]QVV87868.1 hypothetical protein KHC33_11010 [Methanospirillum sp. J.3.6.1-F.2.7.3]
MVNKAGLLLLVLLFIPLLIYADSITSSLTCNGASFVSSSVVQPDATWSERMSTSDTATIIRDILSGGTVQTNTMVKSQGPMGIFEYSTAMSNSTGDQNVCLFDTFDQTIRSRYETTVLGLMQQGSYSSMLLQGNNSRFLVHANGTGILLSRAESDDGRKEMNHGSDALGDLNLTEEMEFGVYDDI